MKAFLAQFGLRITTGHLLWAAVLIPALIAIFIPLDLLWVGITLGVIIAISVVLTVRGRRLTGWRSSPGDGGTRLPRKPRRRRPSGRP